jgi:hypothetical protein
VPALVAYTFTLFLTFNSIEEDAFIYLRNAVNIADGYGYVFNRGGEHIETGSGLVWQLLLVLLAMLPVDLVIATKFLGAAFAVAVLLMMARITQRLVEDKSLLWFPALMLAATTPFYFWSHRGLETPLFVFALLWLFDWCQCGRYRQWWFFPGFVVFAARPEGFLMVAAVLPWLFWQRHETPHFWRAAGLFVLAVLLLQGWRLWYFHDLVPHAFYHKMGRSDLGHSLEDAGNFFIYNGLPLLVLLALPAVFSKRNWRREDLLLISMLIITAIWSVIGADWKSFNRQMSSTLPFFFLLTVALIGRFGFANLARKAVLCCLVLMSLYLLLLGRYTNSRGEVMMSPVWGGARNFAECPSAFTRDLLGVLTDPDGYITDSEPRLTRDFIGFNRNATVGRFIKSNFADNITVVFDQMGQAPWYAGLDKTFIDNVGLTNRMIGYYDFHERAAPGSVYSAYESLLLFTQGLIRGDEVRIPLRQDILLMLYQANPEVVIVRYKFVERRPGSLIATYINTHGFKERYRRAFRINRRDAVYVRKDVVLPENIVIPPASLVEFY